MRLWHKDLIPVLPRQQLLGQWRECRAIAKNIAEKGSPKHLLVNRIMDYPLEHFLRYGEFVQTEMIKRGYKTDLGKFAPFFASTPCNFFKIVSRSELFKGWHNDRYLRQCLYNLQEKRDCGGISDKEWAVIQKHFIIV